MTITDCLVNQGIVRPEVFERILVSRGTNAFSWALPMTQKERRRVLLDLQLRHDRVQGHPVDGLDGEHHMLVEDIGHGLV